MDNQCPMCRGEGYSIGSLGNLEWFRCRQCGWEFSVAVDHPAVPPAPPNQPESPSVEQLEEWESEGGCEATDGCWVEPDGTCEHGCKSWLLVMGLI